MKNLEEKFTEEMLNIYELGKSLFGYSARRFLQKVKKDRGVKAAKSWLKPKSKNTEGFLKLHEFGRLDISMEALVLQKRWLNLFTQDELKVARERLKEFGYNGYIHPEYLRNNEILPEEIFEAEKYIEGAKKIISINSYERNSEARDKCIKYFGASCQICGFNFEKVYGIGFKDFIHVHHKKTLASLSEEYEIEPIKDLIPICPNCHAVVHRKEPPYTVYQVQKMMKKKRINKKSSKTV